ncbi:hypothetical protein DTO96_101574 [Ephemeroptericola cinctiostellae]|uniref:Lipoprotein n=1 Tax=Ephemeroptericola cinctiostellae TaxID=2268024 RepID=A0A345DBU6_9BURK|nr:hypothetical protein [Ephemeroptericola cinctiostellae]AXF85834.1 hypothetical protein DTO96_101574 [Ephemeroptericola cinctiostellae]
MKKTSLLAIALMLTACASTNGISPQASMRLGKIAEKQTFTKQTNHRNPINMGVGIGGGGGHIGWGMNMGLNEIFGLSDYNTTETVFQYKIEVAKNDYLIIQSNQNLSPNQCVTVYELPNNSDYPQIAANLDCKLPATAIQVNK